jgi:hypothetical protein
MANDLVGYSRAGDVFHYRWAAKRCLRMVYPNATLRSMVIEGSAEQGKDGEYVIDATEYHGYDGIDERTVYYQLKHTTVQNEVPFILSDFKTTLEGFAKRFEQHYQKNEIQSRAITFTIITNRKIDDTLKSNFAAILGHQKTEGKFRSTLEKYTGFTSDKLAEFCNTLRMQDGEGNYNVQKQELRVEIAQLVAGTTDNSQLTTLTSLIQEKVLPDAGTEILREDVLRIFGITSEKDLYPAEAIWESLVATIPRLQHEDLKNKILSADCPLIIHAAGGIGKSIFTRQLVQSMSEGSLAIAYDCFGAGRYRNRSETRHQHRNALMQIANELATIGLCDPLIVLSSALDREIMREFLKRIKAAVTALQRSTPTASLVLLIDAADNAEMAAMEFNESSFAHQLLREEIPAGCKLVMLCRTERIELLKPQSRVEQIELEGFSVGETLKNLQSQHPLANDHDGSEFHRLTNGNPRVQANALDAGDNTVTELLTSLGPGGTSVEQQIEMQLQKAVARVKDLLPEDFQGHIDAICMGLASLSPHIPIEILAKAAKVKPEAVKSFVADIGRALWVSDASVQFRDEPTETWFRQTFCATKADFAGYIVLLEPHAERSTYISGVLPQLYMQAGHYEKLITIALSDQYLPYQNPIDARNVRVYRLQFAFKAALKLRKYKDAVKLAMRAGEEVAGDKRQLELLKTSPDLVVSLQSMEKVQEIAFRRLLKAAWTGSENVFSASLLSSIPEFRGEARGFLRAATNWLQIKFDDSKKNKKGYDPDSVQGADILELGWAHLNLNGSKGCIDFFAHLTPKEAVFTIIRDLVKRLIDLGKFDTIDELLQDAKSKVYHIVAITAELFKVGRYADPKSLKKGLALLKSAKTRIKPPGNSFNDYIVPAIVSFAEACLHGGLPLDTIIEVLNAYVPERASHMVCSNNTSQDREVFLKTLAIRTLQDGKSIPVLEDIRPENKKADKQDDKELKEFREVIDSLLPWYKLRAQNLFHKNIPEAVAVQSAAMQSEKTLNTRYRDFDPLPSEVSLIKISMLIESNHLDESQAQQFYASHIENNKSIKINHWLMLLRAAYRADHLKNIRTSLERYCYTFIKSVTDDGPEELAKIYTQLSRAVLVNSVEDASVYFEEAIEIVSKFGDEITQRWEAVSAIAENAGRCGTTDPQLAYRFIRIAEVVGENLREKHWERGKAIQICIRMSPGTGISALSRWREREIGRIDRLHYAFIIELLRSKLLTAAQVWPLTTFITPDELDDFIFECLKMDLQKEEKAFLLEQTITRLKMEGIYEELWGRLNDLGELQGISNQQLDSLTSFYAGIQDSVEESDNEAVTKSAMHNKPEVDWPIFFQNFDLTSSSGLTSAVNAHKLKNKADGFFVPMSVFWREALLQIPEQKISAFIDQLWSLDFIDEYDFREIIGAMPESWQHKVSLQKKWPAIVKAAGRKYAKELTDPYSFNALSKVLKIEGTLANNFKEGILEGLADGNDYSDAAIFFGFVQFTSDGLDYQESVELLDFSLQRFELHVDSEYGDGPWADWLITPANIEENIAAYIWSALGSPVSGTRWRAAHCLRKLAEFNCTTIMDALFGCLQTDHDHAFGVKNFPFYKLNARQYLLIALARIAVGQPEKLLKHSQVFPAYATGSPHFLIQKFSADIIKNLEAAHPGTYSQALMAKVDEVGKSTFPVKEIQYGTHLDSPWHAAGEIKKVKDFYFGWDFDKYWFEPLGDAFGISAEQVQDLATAVVQKQWGITESGYNTDPRVSLWNRSSGERAIHHDHGSYPRTDSYDFYWSYHSMLVVAAQLIKVMPVVSKNNWREDELGEWISRHLLSRADGKWLSDARGEVPLIRPKWTIQIDSDNWQTQITDEDFLDCLLSLKNSSSWLNVKGGWQDKKGERYESVSITSCLVAPNTSQALLNALTTCHDPHDFKLPDYQEEDMEFQEDPFMLRGWIIDRDFSRRLDEYDPFADEVSYPHYTIGEDIKTKMGLTVSPNGSSWHTQNASEPILTGQIWSSYRSNRDEDPEQSGIQLMGSVSFLKRLCSSLKSELVIKVMLTRNYTERHRSSNKKYKGPQHKIFILSPDGKLRSTEKSYQLG